FMRRVAQRREQREREQRAAAAASIQAAWREHAAWTGAAGWRVLVGQAQDADALERVSPEHRAKIRQRIGAWVSGTRMLQQAIRRRRARKALERRRAALAALQGVLLGALTRIRIRRALAGKAGSDGLPAVCPGLRGGTCRAVHGFASPTGELVVIGAAGTLRRKGFAAFL
ncbi:MAG: hypothetical protein AAFU61_18340, partial [Pseudomonadota bacterium]